MKLKEGHLHTLMCIDFPPSISLEYGTVIAYFNFLTIEDICEMDVDTALNMADDRGLSCEFKDKIAAFWYGHVPTIKEKFFS